MAFFTADKLKRRTITVDPSTVSAQSPEVQNRLRRIDENYQAFDELFADIETTIENDDRLREFNANLRAVDLQPKKKKRWRSRAGKTGGKKKTAASAKRISNRTSRTLRKVKDAQISLSKSSTKAPPSDARSQQQKRSRKKPR